MKKNLKGLSNKELQQFVESIGEKKYRATQLFSWIYGRAARSFDEMTDISKDLREILKVKAEIDLIHLVDTRTSQKDGTKKFLFALNDGLNIESVLIPSFDESGELDKRLTLCVSTQVGCPLDCKFCATGRMGFKRNLSAGEIVDQAIQVQKLSERRISNIVYMGMGEPMLNYENVMKSIELLMAENSLAIGGRHITVSTVGYPDKIRQMADEGRKTKLALSLHSLSQEKREKLMPITKKHSVRSVLDTLQYYFEKTKLSPTLEYILFEDFNDQQDDLNQLSKLATRIPCKINLIPYHSIEFAFPTGFGATLRPTDGKRITEFAQRLRDKNVTVVVRESMGEDIEAACGQLAVLADSNRKQV